MQWDHYQGQPGFSFDYPQGWKVEITPFPSCTVSSPDGLWVALIQPLPLIADLTPVETLQHITFPPTRLFPNTKPINVIPSGNEGAEGQLSYTAADGSPGRGQVIYMKFSQMGYLCGIAAPAATFEAAVPVLSRILRTQNETKRSPDAKPAPLTAVSYGEIRPITPGAPASAPKPPPLPKPITYTQFTDPQAGSFVIDVPVGWQITGGLQRPGLGDRRAWFEVNSPDGIYILSDPTFPHSICHVWGGPSGTVVNVGFGGHFLSLKPGAESSADCYLAQVGKRRLPNFVVTGRRPRPDVVAWVTPQVTASGGKIGRKGQIAAIETILNRKAPGPPLVASLLTTCIFNGDYGVGTAFWGSNNLLAVSSVPLATVAETVRPRMASSMKFTGVMQQIVQQDESQIYANAAAANTAQWNWFAGQQAAHQSQVAMGDNIVNSYWAQQQATDRSLRGWEHNQAVYDRLSQDRSDAMLDRQRLADDNAGYTYEVPAGSNYYWRDQQTGQVFGTDASTPPDYSNNYTQLRKL